MTNAEFFTDPYFYATKPADTALQVGLADGSTHSYRVSGRISHQLSDESQMKPGDIKVCDIPADLLSLILENCPLRSKGACMKGDAEPGDGRA